MGYTLLRNPYTSYIFLELYSAGASSVFFSFCCQSRFQHYRLFIEFNILYIAMIIIYRTIT